MVISSTHESVDITYVYIRNNGLMTFKWMSDKRIQKSTEGVGEGGALNQSQQETSF